MNELNSWMQGNWYALGSLLGQFAFLAAGVWFARKILTTIRASQEQLGALLKLSISEGLSERTKVSEATHRPTPYVMADWPTVAAESPALSLPQPEPRTKRLLAPWRGMIKWLRAPMTGHWLAPWRKVAHWLQTPARS